jgi:HIRAN domain
MDPRRFWRIAALLALACGLAHAGEPVRIVVQSSPLAGFRYHAGAEVWPELRVGDRLELAREPDNAHDANAVRVLWRGRVLGYVPRRENAALAWALERGTPLRARISALAEHPNPARRVRFDVYVE